MSLLNFDNAIPFAKTYGGSEDKLPLELEGTKYMVKKPKYILRKNNNLTGEYANNVLSEYIGSHIIETLGLPVHNTNFGVFKDQIIIACEDFTKGDYYCVEFSDILQYSYNSRDLGYVPTYKQLYEAHNLDSRLVPIKDASIARYWEQFVTDSLIGNFDRHAGNWGYIENNLDHTLKLAPIYDCGSSLYCRLSDAGMEEVLKDENQLNQRIYQYPKAALNKKENPRKVSKFSYQELLSGDFYDKNCLNAFKKIYSRIDLDKINNLIDNISILSDLQKHFYKTMISKRFDLILTESYKSAQDKGLITRIHSVNISSKENIKDSIQPTKSTTKFTPSKDAR